MGNERTKQSIEKAAEALRSIDQPLIFCADLNIVSESPNFEPLSELGLKNLVKENNVNTTLSPAHRIYDYKQIACDVMLCSNDIHVNKFEVSDKIISDHKALVLDFELNT